MRKRNKKKKTNAIGWESNPDLLLGVCKHIASIFSELGILPWIIFHGCCASAVSALAGTCSHWL